MIIVMTINNQVIEARAVPPKNLEIQGYLEGLKKDMIEQNEDIIDLTKEKPEFKIHDFTTNKIFIN
jgi:hypothetical protein